MKWFTISFWFIALLSVTAYSQPVSVPVENRGDTIQAAAWSLPVIENTNEQMRNKQYADSLKQARRNARYERKLHNYRTRWEKVIPTHAKLQLAGGIGVVSVGMGWDYGRHNQWETDLMIGYLPKYSSNKGKITLTLKENYIPWSIPIGKSAFEFSPLTCGLYLNTILSQDFWVREPERYPKGYYGFSTRIRIHTFIGERFTYNIKPKMRRSHKSISFYYELCTCDLYLISAFTNKSLTFTDIVSLAVGLKFQIF